MHKAYRIFFSLALAFALPLLTQAASWNLNSMVVFGGGGTDNGNSFQAYGFPYCSTQSQCTQPYWHRRFSNGPIWAEYLAWRFRLIANPVNHPDYNRKKLFLDYAYFGATTSTLYSSHIAGAYNLTIHDEIQAYRTNPHPFAPNTLAIIFTDNDLYSNACLNEPLRCLKTIVAEDIHNILELYHIGIRHFIVITPGKLDNTPFVVTTKPAAYQTLLKAVQLNYATQFAYIQSRITDIHPDANVFIFNLYQYNEDTQAKYNQPLQVPCYNNLVDNFPNFTRQVGPICPIPTAKHYYYYDSIFYSTAVNEALAASIYQTILTKTTWLKRPRRPWWRHFF